MKKPDPNHTPELLSPAGNWECARAAVANGADAIYFGLPRFNARIRADNFTEEDLPELMAFLHQHGVRGFIAFNTLIFTDELEAAERQLRLIDAAGVDAIIVQDLGLARMARAMVPDLELHASTQMSITSPEGLEFLNDRLKLDQAVIARENSLREIRLFHANEPDAVPLETFVHGALCVAYSGQCLTSESLGQRSANRGECAQACRMPYDLVVDGEDVDLGDKRYLLSPQDLAGVGRIPELIQEGIRCFKIEGRLKTPEYVASVTRVYRRAIDAALLAEPEPVSEEDRYQLEMAFSRGLYDGWLEGVNHQELVHARFGKKRGAFLGRVKRLGSDWVEIEAKNPVKAGDGVVFDTGGNTDREQGGRIYYVDGSRLTFQKGKLDLRQVRPGDRIWKTDDPKLNAELRKTWKNVDQMPPRKQRGLSWHVSGTVGTPLTIRDVETGSAVTSAEPLEAAENRPLTDEFLRKQLGRLGGTAFTLNDLEVQIRGEVMLPVSELNRMRRALIAGLEMPTETKRRSLPVSCRELLPEMPEVDSGTDAELRVLCRTENQVDATLEAGAQHLYIDLEDVRRYRPLVQRLRAEHPKAQIFLATPRIQKAGEVGLFRVVERAEPDGVLVRNPGGIGYFRERPQFQMIGDFSLNVSNPVSAGLLMEEGFRNLTVSYDLNIEQVFDLLKKAPPVWFELTLHQHMPMFHMEHCVFCALMSKGTDFTNCGRPCEKHEVQLRDRVGQLHILSADVGCRNTLFNGRAQSGARFYGDLREAGLNTYRVELLKESHEEALTTIRTYQRLLSGEAAGEELWGKLHVDSRLGVTEGNFETASLP